MRATGVALITVFDLMILEKDGEDQVDRSCKNDERQRIKEEGNILETIQMVG
jgi:hypothetical protein